MAQESESASVDGTAHSSKGVSLPFNNLAGLGVIQQLEPSARTVRCLSRGRLQPNADPGFLPVITIVPREKTHGFRARAFFNGWPFVCCIECSGYSTDCWHGERRRRGVGDATLLYEQ